jgi:hypothetical protein
VPVFPRTPFSFPTTKAKAIVHQATARQHARRAALCVSLSLIALAPALACLCNRESFHRDRPVDRMADSDFLNQSDQIQT